MAKRMRLLHVVPSYLPAVRYGGPIVSVHGLCRALVGCGHDVHVFTTNIDGPSDSDVPLGVPVERDGVTVWYFAVPVLRRLFWSPAMKYELHRQVNSFDVVHAHSVFLWPTWAAVRAARGMGVPYVMSPRGMLVKELIRRRSRWAKSAWISLIERRNLEGAAAVHVTSPGEAAELGAFGFRLKRVVEIPNGVDVPKNESQPPLRTNDADFDDERTLLFLGRINWKKGLDRLIEAIALVPEAQLIVAGNDEERYTDKLKRLAAGAGVSGRVRFIGPAYGEDKWRLLQRARCFVLPSYSENFGNAVLEAMAAGCPVVVTPEVGIAETVARSGSGIVVKGEPVSLAAVLRQAIHDPAGREQMGAAGRRTAESEFGWPAIARKMTNAYAKISKQG